MRKRALAHLVAACLAIAAFAVVLPYSAPNAPDCAPTATQPRQFVQRDSASKIKMIVTNAADGLKGMPAEAALFTGSNEDQSPEWTNPADGRTYWYESMVFLLWSESAPDCNGDDTYYAVMETTCRRHGPSGNVDTPCWFDNVELALHRGTLDAGTWVNPWGYHKYVRSNDTACEATNTGHTIPDNRLARSKMVAHMNFLNPFNESEVLHPTQTREMTSHYVHRGTTLFFGQDLTAATLPSPTVGPSIC